MFCPRCGDPIEYNEKFCNKCGLPLNNNINQINYQPYHNPVPKPNKNKMVFIGLGVGFGILLLIFLGFFLITNLGGDYYFSNNDYDEPSEIVSSPKPSSSTVKRGKYRTVIITDNTYSGVKVNKVQDAYDLISKDSVSQKVNCPSKIKQIENEIINKYQITAVNLCEMDVSFAKEIANVFKKIYDEYPSVRGYITNVSLINGSLSDNYIAAFMPAFNFASSDTPSTYPWVIKTQILLNTTYFLNKARLETSVNDGSNSGHFPPNATIYSPIAHELGHYLSFLAMMKSYQLKSILLVNNNNIETFYDMYSDFGDGIFSLSMIQEAYENYKKDIGTTLNIDQWRAQISNYAVAKDNNGNYIYDETIAEAFHDVYLNDNNAKDVSKYIVNVLKKRLG